MAKTRIQISQNVSPLATSTFRMYKENGVQRRVQLRIISIVWDANVYCLNNSVYLNTITQ